MGYFTGGPVFSCQRYSCFSFLRITHKKLYIHSRFMLELLSQRWYDSTFPEASYTQMWWIKTASCIVVGITAVKINSHLWWLASTVDRHSSVVLEFYHEWTAIWAKTMLFFWGSEEWKKGDTTLSGVWIKISWKLVSGMKRCITKLLVKIYTLLLLVWQLLGSQWFYAVLGWFLDVLRWFNNYLISHASKS